MVEGGPNGQELPGAVARHAVTDEETGLHVERGEARGRAVAPVIMGHGGGATLLQRQPGLGPVERLDLRLLVDAQHDRAAWRVEVEPTILVTSTVDGKRPSGGKH